jgi:hypothetical protein
MEFIISVAVSLSVVAYSSVSAIKNRNKSLSSFKKRSEGVSKSRFRHRLDKAMEQANTKS